jgi:hypothetical protein
MDDSEQVAVRQLLLMSIVSIESLAALGHDLRGAAGPVVAEVSSLLGISPENRPLWVRQATQ